MQQLEHEKFLRELAENELKEVKQCKVVEYRKQQQIREIHESVQDAAAKMQKMWTPSTVKAMKLKQHIQELYIGMGYSHDQARFRTLRAAEEWD